MSRTFKRHGDAIRATFERFEVELLRNLHDQLDALLRDPDGGDPVIRRLFPPPVLGDPDVEAEVRSLLGPELLGSRRAGLEAFVGLLDRGQEHRGRVRVELVDDDPLLVLGVLNDIRLAIGASIDIDALDRTSLSDDDPVVYRLAVMDHLAGLQEQLLAIVDPPSVAYSRELGPDDLAPDDGAPDEV